MYPGPLMIFGSMWATWNLLFLLGVAVGYWVLRSTLLQSSPQQIPRLLLVRYLFCVYVCAIGAQWFAYAFDSNTTVLPPAGFNFWRYYFHPLAGPKTLYGAILLLPLGALAFVPAGSLRPASAVNLSTPALFAILGFARIGCLLQGCCYGLRTEHLSISFPVGSSVHADQYAAGLIAIHDSSLPVLPVQLLSAVACFGVFAWSSRQIREHSSAVYLKAVGAYSVFRFFVEFVRADDARNHYWAFSTSQWIALLVLSGLLCRWLQSRRSELQYQS